MITVQWLNNETCENCGQMKPHCAVLHIEKLLKEGETEPDETGLLDMKFCSDCVEDLKRRLS